MAGAHQCQRTRDLLLGGAQLPPQQRQFALGDQFQVVACDFERGLVAGGGRIQLPQLQLDALTHRARPDAGGVERLHAGEHGTHFLGGALDLRAQGVRNLFERFGEIAIVADGVDDGAPDRQLPRREAGQFQLPQQVFLQ